MIIDGLSYSLGFNSYPFTSERVNSVSVPEEEEEGKDGKEKKGQENHIGAWESVIVEKLFKF